MDLLNGSYLFASLIWGSIGMGYFIYGKKRPSIHSAIGGIVMIAMSYVISSALWMSLASIAVMVAVYYLAKRDS